MLFRAILLATFLSAGLAKKTTGHWEVELNGKVYEDTKIQARKDKGSSSSTPLGDVVKFRGEHIAFDFNVKTFAILNTLTGAEAPDRLVSEPTVIFTSKTPAFDPSLIANPTLKSLEVKEETASLIINVKSGKYKVTAKDNTQGGTLQTEPELGGLGLTNYTHVLAPGIFYFLNPYTGKINFGNGQDAVSKSEDSKNYHNLFVGKDSPEAATKVFQGGNTSIWAVQAGGRIASVFGEDAIEATPAAGNCTSSCENQNQIHGSLDIPQVGVVPIA